MKSQAFFVDDDDESQVVFFFEMIMMIQRSYIAPYPGCIGRFMALYRKKTQFRHIQELT